MATRGMALSAGGLGLACVAVAGLAFGATRARAPTQRRAVDAAPRAIEQRPPASAICCCRVYARQGWQYSWLAPASCAQASGSCVSPDHC